MQSVMTITSTLKGIKSSIGDSVNRSQIALCGVFNRPQSALWCQKSEKTKLFQKIAVRYLRVN